MASVGVGISLYGKVKVDVVEHASGVGAYAYAENVNIFFDHENWEAIQHLADVLKKQHDKANRTTG